MTAHRFNLAVRRIARLLTHAKTCGCPQTARMIQGKARQLSDTLTRSLPSDVLAYWQGGKPMIHGRGRTWIGKVTDDLFSELLPEPQNN